MPCLWCLQTGNNGASMCQPHHQRTTLEMNIIHIVRSNTTIKQSWILKCWQLFLRYLFRTYWKIIMCTISICPNFLDGHKILKMPLALFAPSASYQWIFGPLVGRFSSFCFKFCEVLSRNCDLYYRSVPTIWHHFGFSIVYSIYRIKTFNRETGLKTRFKYNKPIVKRGS